VLLEGINLFELLFAIAAFGFDEDILDIGFEITLIVHHLLNQSP
jgi:hypothetical protein